MLRTPVGGELPDLEGAVGEREDYLALARAGFTDVQLHHEEGNMALWSGTNPA